MRRFILSARKTSAVSLLLQGYFMATSSVSIPNPDSTNISTNIVNTTTEISSTQQKGLNKNNNSPPLVALLASVVSELQHRSKDATRQDTVSMPSLKLQPEELINAFSKYIRREDELTELCRSKVPSVRRHFLTIRAQRSHLSTLQRDILLHEISRIVEKREIPPTVAAQLFRSHWPDQMMDVAGSRHHSFLTRSFTAWVTQLLHEKKLTSGEARQILTFSPRVFNGQVALVGSLVECALADMNSNSDAEPLIQLMWAVNNAKTHAPHHFWQRAVEMLAKKNRSLRDQVGDAIHSSINTKKKNESVKGKIIKTTTTETTHMPVGHVFSGLTTRQLFRILRVLKREQWCGDVPTIYDFVDKALKNIVFEAEALSAADDKPHGKPLTRKEIMQRVQKASGLTPLELLSLMHIAGEIGLDIHVSLARVSDYLLAPMVVYLNREQLLLLTTCVRKTRCDSLQLVQAIVDTIVQRGITYPSSIILCKATLRTVMQKTSLLSQLTLAPFMDHIFGLCERYKYGMRASQILDWVELLYALSRRYAPTSSVGIRVRACVESFAAPLRAMLSVGAVPTSLISRVLEHSVILGMRHQPQYPLTEKLWEERNAVVNKKNRKSKQAVKEEEEEEDEVSLLDSHDGIETTTRIKEEEDNNHNISTFTTDDVNNSFGGEIARAALEVYEDLIYTYERQMVLRHSLSTEEMNRLRATFHRVGLYNLFVGAFLFKQLHLLPNRTAINISTQFNSETPPPQALSAWMEREISSIIDSRLQTMKKSLSSHTNSTENTINTVNTLKYSLLRVFGQRQCDAVKVRRFIQLVRDSPLLLSRQRRSVWEFISLLAQQYGGPEEQAMAQELLTKALY
ncbi:uncharacterized protein TM35_000411750 [Trypanosoma theileri]|uniref:Mitochondrial RNA binding protein n=1 Tax=Trypanosoma theileri TaxID=67003 RepID=A0A1X0NJ92_9TRYP|nr:uncharacterized protein TM35_000411750 [Trypanosoma theileri]ORC84805.1 hypothetical protein TM35_000411750 [Trypanosoma theileri]